MAAVEAWVVAAALLAGAMPFGLEGSGPLDACSGTQFELPPVTAPLQTSNSGGVDGSSAVRYCLYGEPSFPFRGTVTAELQDTAGTVAVWRQVCYMTGLPVPLVPPVAGCEGPTGSNPTLVPGPMTLRCYVTGVHGEPVAAGVWTCGVVLVLG